MGCFLRLSADSFRAGEGDSHIGATVSVGGCQAQDPAWAYVVPLTKCAGPFTPHYPTLSPNIQDHLHSPARLVRFFELGALWVVHLALRLELEGHQPQLPLARSPGNLLGGQGRKVHIGCTPPPALGVRSNNEQGAHLQAGSGVCERLKAGNVMEKTHLACSACDAMQASLKGRSPLLAGGRGDHPRLSICMVQ